MTALAVVAGIVLGVPAGATADDDAAPPPPIEVMSTYRVIREWVDTWALPRNPPAERLPACAGASITLRLDGQTVGRGGDLLGSVAAGDRDQSAGRSVWRAMLAAFAEADRRIPAPRDATRPQAMRALAPRLMISLELAGAPTPIEPATFADLDATLAPGIDGVGARLNNRIEAAFPSAMLLSGQTPAEAARAMVAKLTGSAVAALAEAGALRERQGVVFFRFRVNHLVQCAPEQPPRFLTRGHAQTTQAALGSAELRSMADAIAAHLRRRAHTGDAPLGMRGTYRPCEGEFAPGPATVREQALAAAALRRYARQTWVEPGHARAAARFADDLLHDLDDVDLDETRPWEDAVDAALCVLALREPDGPFGGEVRASHVDLLTRCTQRVGAAFSAGKGFEGGLAAPARAAVAAALAHGAGDPPSAQAAVRLCFKEAPPGGLAGMMPLLGWAELQAGGRPIPSAVALRQMRAQLWSAQLGDLPAGDDRADCAGGVVFSPAERFPTWHCLKPIAFAAAMLREPELTPPDAVPGELARLLGAARFLRQLQADETTAWMYAAPEVAHGGIRAAVWDQSMPTDASSIGLISVCELIESLEAMSTP